MDLFSLSYYPQAMDLLFYRTRPKPPCANAEKRTSVALDPVNFGQAPVVIR